MKQRLTELTGVGARASAPETHVPAQRAHSATRHAPTPKRSVVRHAIALLLQQPSLGLQSPAPFAFEGLQQPGIALLVELLDLVHRRPDISTGSLIEHFADREEQAALQKLASQAMPGDEEAWRAEFLDAIAQLERTTLQQRIDELHARVTEGGFAALSSQEKSELLALQSAARRG
ncbi:MAG TPA: hypothetical protein VFR30_11265 [Lysobacter sp.]|nr:hypothetical protein [Lysobacter sp.]